MHAQSALKAFSLYKLSKIRDRSEGNRGQGREQYAGNRRADS